MKDTKRDLIINKAKAIFARFGFEKTTMDDIARAINMGKSSLYYYFENKVDVFTEVIKKEIGELKALIGKSIDTAKDPRDKMEAFISTRIEYFYKMSDYYTGILNEYLALYEFIENLRKDFSIWEIKTIRGILQEGVNAGLFSIKKMDPVAEGIFYGLKGLEYPVTTSTDIGNLQKSIKAYLEVLFYGIIKR